jgi:hypothetical protein
MAVQQCYLVSVWTWLRACEHEHMNTIKYFKEYFDDMNNIFLQKKLLRKIDSKMTWKNILCGHGWNHNGWRIMDEIHH